MTISTDMLSLNGIARIEPDASDGLPVLVRAPTPGVRLRDWIAAHRDEVAALVTRHPALLFRGYDVGSAPGFEQAVLALGAPLQMAYGDLAQTVERCTFVQEATSYPSNQAILFHHEASHTPAYPRHIWFYCQQPPATGGETPLLDSRRLLDRLPTPLRQQFERRGLRYVRNFVPGLDVSWQHFFGTEDRAAVEAQCRDRGVEWTWRSDGGLRTVTARPAIVPHPADGTPVFFNQILLHHPACVEPETREALAELFGDQDGPRVVTFGDGTPITDEQVEAVLAASIETASRFTWQTDDVVMVDNLAVAHSRRPFSGTRVIRVALSTFVTDAIAESA